MCRSTEGKGECTEISAEGLDVADKCLITFQQDDDFSLLFISVVQKRPNLPHDQKQIVKITVKGWEKRKV